MTSVTDRDLEKKVLMKLSIRSLNGPDKIVDEV